MRVAAGERFVEVGCGAGLVAIHAARSGARVMALDVNRQAVRLTRENARRNRVHVDVVRGDLLGGVRGDRLDIVAFNPPYLPTSIDEHVPGPLDDAFAGGPGGADVVQRFLAQAETRLVPRVLLLGSSLVEPPVPELGRRAGFAARTLAKRTLDFETLTVYELTAPAR